MNKNDKLKYEKILTKMKEYDLWLKIRTYCQKNLEQIQRQIIKIERDTNENK